MSRRKWLARGLVLLIVAGLAAVGLAYQHWTNPAAVRQKVVDQVTSHFVGVQVSLESARLRLFGGIAVRELRLSRRDDLERTDFAYFPSATIYHDKEQLLEGKLAVRKIELHRPRLRIVRHRDGRWNVAGVLGPVEPDKQIPTLVFQQATLVIEDQTAAPGTPALELRQVQLTLINDPLPTVRFEGTGTSDAVKTVRVHGQWQRLSGETRVTIEADGIPVGPALAQRCSACCPDLTAHLRQLEGTGKLEGELLYRPEASEPWTHDFRFHLNQGRFQHARLPVPLEQLRGFVHTVNGRVETGQLTARAGVTEIELTIAGLRPLSPLSPLSTGELHVAELADKLDLRIKHLPLTRELFERLPGEYQELYRQFQPAGPASLTLTCQHLSGGGWRRNCVVQPEGLKACCAEFPYPVEQITGTLEHETGSGREEVLKINLTGLAGARPVFVKGEVVGPPDQRAVSVDVWGNNLVLDEPLLAALPAEHQQVARAFHATGQGDFKALIRCSRGAARYSSRYIVQFHHGTLRYDLFPYPLENVSGTLDIQPEHWEFRDFVGTHKGGKFRTSGRSTPGPEGERLVMDIEGTNILLDDEMAAAMEKEPELKNTWKVFSPSGRIAFRGRIDRVRKQQPEIDLTVFPLGCTIWTEFFPYAMEVSAGRIRYARRWVQLEKLAAHHGPTRLSLDEGLVYLKPEGGAWVRLTGLRGNPLVPDGDFLEALPPPLRKTCKALELKDPVGLTTELVIDVPPEPSKPPVIFWDGALTLRNATLDTGVKLERVSGQLACRGRHNGKQVEGMIGNLLLDELVLFRQPLRNVQSAIEMTADEPEVLKLPGLRASLFGGEVYGPLRIEFGPPLRYNLNLTAAQVKLEEFGRHNFSKGAELQGLATARLYLSGQGSDIHDLKGGGTIDVPSGKLYNLPLLLDLLKVLGLRLPDRTAFEEAHAVFTIEGPRASISRLDLYGNAISLRGQGKMNLDGSDTELDFHADWARITQVLPAVIDRVPMAISDQLLRIRMRGPLSDVKFTKEPVPLLMDPFRKMVQSKPKANGRGK